jgi:hypothetical protein
MFMHTGVFNRYRFQRFLSHKTMRLEGFGDINLAACQLKVNMGR